MVRGYMIINAICIAIPAAVWIASVQVEYPDRLALVWIAIFLGLSSYASFGLGNIFNEYLQTCSGYYPWYLSSGGPK